MSHGEHRDHEGTEIDAFEVARLPFDDRHARPHEATKTQKQADTTFDGLRSRFRHLARRRATHADVERFLVILVLFVVTSRERELRKIPVRTQ